MQQYRIPRTSRRTVLSQIGIACGLMTAGCTGGTRLPAVPRDAQMHADPPGMAGMRYSSIEETSELVEEGLAALRREERALRTTGHRGRLPPASYLAVSGGGEDGAFGAGLLVGWTAHGDRPEFKLVTGVSTGALIAPFAFLGPGCDAKLKSVYTEIDSRDIAEERWLGAALLDDAVADSAPLRRLVRHMLDTGITREIAAEYQQGRLLMIGTTNLDGRRGVIWNLGKIAASGHPRANRLIEDVLVASASIPGLFPPVMIDVEANGQRYQEMHVDGGVSAQVFAYPPTFQLGREAGSMGALRERHLYIIRNGRFDPEWEQVERRTLSIAGRSVSAMIQNQGVGDTYRIYATAQRDKVDYNLAFIPPTTRPAPKEPFDRRYMNELFDLGYRLGRNGYPWSKTPPGLGGARS